MAWQASEDGGHKSKERKEGKEKDGRAGLSPGAEKSRGGEAKVVLAGSQGWKL